jgi:hypothetical protein
MCLHLITRGYHVKDAAPGADRDVEQGELVMPPPAYTQERERLPVPIVGDENPSSPMPTINLEAPLGQDEESETPACRCRKNPAHIINKRR